MGTPEQLSSSKTQQGVAHSGLVVGPPTPEMGPGGGDGGAAGDRPRGEAALPAAHHRSAAAAAARAAATAPGAAAAAASSTPVLPTSRRPRRLSGRPARAHAPAPKTGAHRPLPGTRRGRPGAGTPRPGHVSAGRPARSPAPPGRPPAPGRGSEPGRRVSTARRARCLLPFPGKPSLNGECHTASAHARVPQPYERAENGAIGAPHHPAVSQVPQLWEGATNGAQEGPSNFSLLALLPSGGGAAVDCRAERTQGRGTSDISVQCLSVCSW